MNSWYGNDEYATILIAGGVILIIIGIVLLFLLKKKDIQLIEGEEQVIFLHGYNVQALGENRVLSLASNQIMNQKMRDKGVEVIEVNLSETLKLGGGIHCMTFPLLRG